MLAEKGMNRINQLTGRPKSFAETNATIDAPIDR